MTCTLQLLLLLKGNIMCIVLWELPLNCMESMDNFQIFPLIFTCDTIYISSDTIYISSDKHDTDLLLLISNMTLYIDVTDVNFDKSSINILSLISFAQNGLLMESHISGNETPSMWHFYEKAFFHKTNQWWYIFMTYIHYFIMKNEINFHCWVNNFSATGISWREQLPFDEMMMSALYKTTTLSWILSASSLKQQSAGHLLISSQQVFALSP